MLSIMKKPTTTSMLMFTKMTGAMTGSSLVGLVRNVVIGKSSQSPKKMGYRGGIENTPNYHNRIGYGSEQGGLLG